MEIVVPVPLELKYTYGSQASSYPVYSGSAAQYYYANDYVFDPVAAGGNDHNYRAVRYMTTHSRPSQSSSEDWEDLGLSLGNITGYVSSAPVSNYPAFVLANYANYTKGERVFSAFSQREYEALREPVPQLRPEVSITHPQASLAGAWLDVGPLNAARCLDPRSSLRTIATSPLTMTVIAEGDCDRIAFFGLQNVASVQINVANAAASVPTTSIEIGNSGIHRSSRIFSHAPVTDPEYQITLSGSADPVYNLSSRSTELQVGAVVAGKAVDCGPTEVNLSNSLVTPRIVEDDYGNVSRSQQWYSKRIQGVLRPPARTADLALAILANTINRPIMIDFSRGALAETGPLVYGFLAQATQTLVGLPDADAIDVVIRGYSQ